MNQLRPSDMVIVGAGMAGLSTAIWARRLGLSAVVLEREAAPGGQLTVIRGKIVDYPGVDLPDGAALTDRLLRQAREAGAEIRLDWKVEAVEADRLTYQTAHGPVTGRNLVIATGITARRLGIPGEEELYRARLVRRPSHDLAWFAGKRVAVIGGGDRAAENGLMLAEVAGQVVVLHRGERLRARQSLAEPLLAHRRVAVRWQSKPARFVVGEQGVRIETEGPGQAEPTEVDAVCIYIGNQPNSDLVAGQAERDPEGYIVTDRYGQTSLPGLYAVGDVCTLPPYQSLVTAGGQAMVVAKQIALNRQG